MFYSYSWDLARATRLARLFEQHHPDKKITLIGGTTHHSTTCNANYAMHMPVQCLQLTNHSGCSSNEQRLGESETRFLASFCQPHLLADAGLRKIFLGTASVQAMPIKQNITQDSFAAEEHHDETCHSLKSSFHNRAVGGEKPQKPPENSQNRGEYELHRQWKGGLKVTCNSLQGGDLIFTGAGEIAFDAYKEWFVSWGPAGKIKVCMISHYAP